MRRTIIRLRRPALWPAVMFWAVLFGALPLRAQAPDSVEYTFARRHDTLVVWLNLARYFGDDELAGLTEGIDYVCRYEIELKRPRRLWGAVEVARVSGRVRVARLPVTQNYTLTFSGKDSLTDSREFAAADGALDFLADSEWVPLAAIDSLDPGAEYVANLSISIISLTTFNLAANEQAGDGSESPIKYLFRQFLKVTGYGRRDYSTSSRKFNLSEVYPIE